MNELKNRGAQDILIAVVDGLKGFPEAINAVFPQTVIQTCIVHLIRHSMDFASWKDRKSVAQALGATSPPQDSERSHIQSPLRRLGLEEASQWNIPRALPIQRHNSIAATCTAATSGGEISFD